MPFDPLVFQPMDPDNAFLGWVVSALGEVLLAGATRAVLGTPAERALRGAISRAIDASADQLAAGRTDVSRELQVALRRSRRALAQPERFADLPQLVHAWVSEVDADSPAGPLSARGVDRSRLADVLCAEIIREVIADGLRRGPLQPLAAHANFQVAFGLSREVLAQLGPIKGMLEEILRMQHEQAQRGSQEDPADGALTLIEDRAATFTGRKHILDQLDAIIGQPAFPCGYVLVTGEPGIGKTALLSQVIKTKKYPYHLNNRRQGVTSAAAFLNSICGQLADRYGIPVPSAPSSMALSRLLRAAAEGAGPRSPLVIAVDALDESEPSSAGANRLLLPQVLPPHVYFLITSRPQADYQLTVDRLKIISIEDDDPLNFQDIRTYIHRELNGPFASDFAQRITAWRISEQTFTDTLADKSQGNFMYIVHMLSSVRLNRLTRAALDDIRQLPTGLKGYYLDHWQVMQRLWPAALWQKHEAAVRCLAVMNRPVSPAMLVDIAGEQNLPGVDESLARAIFTEWREFLNSQRDITHDEERYYIYHETFREFLDDKETLKPLERRIQGNQISLLRQILDEDY
jgi:hypothetical protein